MDQLAQRDKLQRRRSASNEQAYAEEHERRDCDLPRDVDQFRHHSISQRMSGGPAQLGGLGGLCNRVCGALYTGE